VDRTSLRHWLRFIGLALAFAVAYTQLPLYSWDQNTYFLHGLAQAGQGYLAADPLARTADPMPVFSALVVFTCRVLAEPFFYVYQVIILGVYFYALVDIARQTTRVGEDAGRYLAFVTLLVTVHSSLARAASVAAFGTDLFRPFTTAIASYGVIGLVFQPSTFSAFLVLSVALFLRRRTVAAVFALALAGTVHPTYLMVGASLTLSYMIALYGQGRSVKEPALLGGLALVLVFPIAVYVFRNFGETSQDIARRAYGILVNYRIPHHASPRAWFGVETVIQVLLILAALYLTRKTRLYPVLAVTSLAAAALTFVQIVTGDLRLALVSPWRISVVLVPVSTACVLASAVDRFPSAARRYRRWWYFASALVLTAVVAGGVASAERKFDLRANDPARAVARYVKETRTAGSLYLVPPDMEDFRLATGAPVFVDHKSFPYRDVEIVAWYDRLELAERFYGEGSADCALLGRLAVEHGVTHLVAPAALGLAGCSLLERQYSDGTYSVFAIHRAPADAPRQPVEFGGGP